MEPSPVPRKADPTRPLTDSIDTISKLYDAIYEIQRTVGAVVPPNPAHTQSYGVDPEDLYIDAEDNPEAILDTTTDSAWAKTFNRLTSVFTTYFTNISETTDEVELTRFLIGELQSNGTTITVTIQYPIAGPVWLKCSTNNPNLIQDTIGAIYIGALARFDIRTAAEQLFLLRIASYSQEYETSLTELIDYYGVASQFKGAMPQATSIQAWADYRDRHPETIREHTTTVRNTVPSENRPPISSTESLSEEDYTKAVHLLFGSTGPVSSSGSWEEPGTDVGFSEDDTVSTDTFRELIDRGYVDPVRDIWGNNAYAPTYGALLRFMERVDAVGGAVVYLNGKVWGSNIQGGLERGGLVDVSSFGIHPTDETEEIPHYVLALLDEFYPDNLDYPDSQGPITDVGLWWD